jgi:hypothetical protein
MRCGVFERWATPEDAELDLLDAASKAVLKDNQV